MHPRGAVAAQWTIAPHASPDIVVIAFAVLDPTSPCLLRLSPAVVSPVFFVIPQLGVVFLGSSALPMCNHTYVVLRYHFDTVVDHATSRYPSV